MSKVKLLYMYISTVCGYELCVCVCAILLILLFIVGQKPCVLMFFVDVHPTENKIYSILFYSILFYSNLPNHVSHKIILPIHISHKIRSNKSNIFIELF